MTEMTESAVEFSGFEKRALQELRAWNEASPSFVQRAEKSALDAVAWFAQKPVSQITDRAVPFVNWLVERTHATAYHTFPTQGVLKAFRKQGVKIDSLSEIQSLDLEARDTAASSFYLWNLCLTVAEGAATGVVGIPGLVIDLPAMFTANFRLIQQMGMCYGYSMDGPEGLMVSLAVMDYSSADPKQKVEAFLAARASLEYLERRMAEKAVAEGEVPLIVGLVRKTATSLGVKLTDEQIGKMIPIIGAGIGAIWNGRFLQQNAINAQHLFRLDSLRRKYGQERLGEELERYKFPTRS